MKPRLNQDTIVLLIHGYTGGEGDFGELASYLEKEYSNIEVHVPRLPGHGTKIEDLDDVWLSHFMEVVEREFSELKKENKKVVLGGVSFGAQLALIMAGSRRINGVFTVCIPYKFKFPFSVYKLEKFAPYKKYWKKYIPRAERPLRTESVFYEHMHSNGIIVTKDANARIDKSFKNIKSPILNIHSTGDKIGSWRSVNFITKKVSSDCKKNIVLNDRHHNLFYSPSRSVLYGSIANFIGNDVQHYEPD